jgi:hypothetical protein
MICLSQGRIKAGDNDFLPSLKYIEGIQVFQSNKSGIPKRRTHFQRSNLICFVNLFAASATAITINS